MKERTNFVSNSSSTSFILINKKKDENEESICLIKNITLSDLNSTFYKSDDFEDFIKYFFRYYSDETVYNNTYLNNNNHLCEGEKLFIQIKREENEKKKNMLMNKFLKICKEENENIYKFLLKIKRAFIKEYKVLVLDEVEYNSLDLKLLNISNNKELEIVDLEDIYK